LESSCTFSPAGFGSTCANEPLRNLSLRRRIEIRRTNTSNPRAKAKTMRIEMVRALPGPNVHLHQPVLHARIELEDLAEVDSDKVSGFTDRLLALLPGLSEHHCGLGYPGGFVERLHGGTYFGHIVEHVAIELQNVVGVEVHYGKTRIVEAPGLYDMVIEYRNEPVARFLLEEARKLVDLIAHRESFAKEQLEALLAEAQRLLIDTELGPSTRAIVDAAEKRGIPWWRLDDGSLVQLGQGSRRRLTRAAVGDRTGALAVEVACDKEMTKRILGAAAIPVPKGVVARSEQEAWRRSTCCSRPSSSNRSTQTTVAA
jgi:cyanophycin synthetase